MAAEDMNQIVIGERVGGEAPKSEKSGSLSMHSCLDAARAEAAEVVLKQEIAHGVATFEDVTFFSILLARNTRGVMLNVVPDFGLARISCDLGSPILSRTDPYERVMFPEIMVQINFDALPCAGKKTFLLLRFRNSQCAAFKVNVKSALFSSSLSLPTLSIHVGIKPCEHTRSPRCGASHSLSDRHCRQDFAAAHHPSPQHRERERHGESGTAASHVTELPQPPSLT
jgi:hypothetical protein